MEGKKVVMMMSGLLVVVAVLAGQIQVGAAERSCCFSANTRNIFDACGHTGLPKTVCARISGCLIVDDADCPAGWKNDILENTSSSSVQEYCKLGCVSSVCGAITTLRHSDASEVVNGAAEKCTDACSDFCTKGAAVTA